MDLENYWSSIILGSWNDHDLGLYTSTWSIMQLRSTIFSCILYSLLLTMTYQATQLYTTCTLYWQTRALSSNNTSLHWYENHPQVKAHIHHQAWSLTAIITRNVHHDLHNNYSYLTHNSCRFTFVGISSISGMYVYQQSRSNIWKIMTFWCNGGIQSTFDGAIAIRPLHVRT